MPLTCAVCTKTVHNIGELADHISDTSRIEETEWTPDDFNEIARSPKELERRWDVTRGFSHTKYRDKTGNLLPENAATVFYVTMMAGAKWCIECKEAFPNNFRMYRHYFDTQHGQDWKRPERAQENLTEMEELEAKWF